MIRFCISFLSVTFALNDFLITSYMSELNFQILRRRMPWQKTFFFQKTDVLYQMTYVFCRRFLPAHGDRTVDQMVQAARSGKQNIVEGLEDGVTSTEMHIKLLNVSRSSILELREDYRDFLQSRNLTVWDVHHERFKKMYMFCKEHNQLKDYLPFFEVWTSEEMANVALTLCYMVDSLLNNHLKMVEEEFVKEGGIKERMHAARTGYRQAQMRELEYLRHLTEEQSQEIKRLKQLLKAHGISE